MVIVDAVLLFAEARRGKVNVRIVPTYPSSVSARTRTSTLVPMSREGTE
jgi:hypothetical protein